jgi:hypothetical protein
MKNIYIILISLFTLNAYSQNDTLLDEKIVPVEINITHENLKPITYYYYDRKPFFSVGVYSWPDVNSYTSVNHHTDLTFYNLNVKSIISHIFINTAHTSRKLNTTAKIQKLQGLRYSYIGCRPRSYVTCEDLGYDLTTTEVIYEKIILDILGNEFTNTAIISSLKKDANVN